MERGRGRHWTDPRQICWPCRTKKGVGMRELKLFDHWFMSVIGVVEVDRGQLDKYWVMWEEFTVLVHILESVLSEDSTRQKFKYPQGIPKFTDTSSQTSTPMFSECSPNQQHNNTSPTQTHQTHQTLPRKPHEGDFWMVCAHWSMRTTVLKVGNRSLEVVSLINCLTVVYLPLCLCSILNVEN